jgi:hypothetical protein
MAALVSILITRMTGITDRLLSFPGRGSDDKHDKMAFEGLLSYWRAQVRDHLPRTGVGTTSASLLFGTKGTSFLHLSVRELRPWTPGSGVHSSVLPRGSDVPRHSLARHRPLTCTRRKQFGRSAGCFPRRGFSSWFTILWKCCPRGVREFFSR